MYGGELHLYFIAVLAFAICFDWTGAVAASKKDGTYASAYGIQGVMRTAVMLALPAWGSMVDILLKVPVPAFFFVLWGGIFFHTCVSMTANFKRAGWDRWIPNWAIEWVASEIEAKIRRSEARMPTPGATLENTPPVAATIEEEKEIEK
ncbi:phage holin family protein [Bacillus canaveralius]|uniref:phage holin family protein n=1 Tax=Bacillus canaveralius TaxID=1403243 RepID=UPI001FE30FAE|nr:phage holin family protein [Bacillus canaveralius]